MGNVLGREQILAAEDRDTIQIEVPEWGGSVLIRKISGKQRGRIEGLKSAGTLDFADFRGMMCACSICDEDGFQIFTNDDVDALGEKSADALDRVFDAALRLNGMAAGAVEEAKKN